MKTKTASIPCTDENGNECDCIEKECQKCKTLNLTEFDRTKEGNQVVMFTCKGCGELNVGQVCKQ